MLLLIFLFIWKIRNGCGKNCVECSHNTYEMAAFQKCQTYFGTPCKFYIICNGKYLETTVYLLTAHWWTVLSNLERLCSFNQKPSQNEESIVLQ